MVSHTPAWSTLMSDGANRASGTMKRSLLTCRIACLLCPAVACACRAATTLHAPKRSIHVSCVQTSHSFTMGGAKLACKVSLATWMRDVPGHQHPGGTDVVQQLICALKAMCCKARKAHFGSRGSCMMPAILSTPSGSSTSRLTSLRLIGNARAISALALAAT